MANLDGFVTFCQKKKIKTAYLAELLHVAVSTARGYTTGTANNLPHWAVIAIADQYKVSCDEVLGHVSLSRPAGTYDISAEHRQLSDTYAALRKMYDERVKELQVARDKCTALQQENQALNERTEKQSASQKEDMNYRDRCLRYEITFAAIQALLKEK